MKNVTRMIPLNDVANVSSTGANGISTVVNLISSVVNATSTAANVTSTVTNVTSIVANVTSTADYVTSNAANVTEIVTDMENIYPSYVIAFFYSFFTMIIVMNVPSVFILNVSLCRNIDLKNSQMLLSLSITDMFFGVCCVVGINSNLKSDGISYNECLWRYIIASVSYSVSNIHVFCISFERVCEICLKLNIFTENRKMCSFLSVILSWTFSGAFVALVIILGPKDNGERECPLSRLASNEFPYVYLMAITFQVGTIINITILAIFLFRHVRQMQKLNLRKEGPDNIRLCITVTIISAVCTVLHLPWVIIRIYEPLVESQPQFVRNAAFIFAAFPSIINPIIYIFRIRKFRQLLINSINAMCC
ncbi:TAAR [Mytilus edulis]|uniref:TAAR n=1 Tax=Mytilus edulis TaxID=6550 RepID=A0A8S3RHK6_MYTED|nr:TAAR [Mytilus edulis]